MKKIFVTAALSLFSLFSFAQVSSTLSGTMPLIFTSTGTGNYAKTVIYNDFTGFIIDLAKSPDAISGTPINFKIDARGGGHNFLNILGSNGFVGIGLPTPTFKLHVKGPIAAEGDGAGNYPDLNLKNGAVRWHISGPRYGENNRLGIFWHDGTNYYDRFTITTTGDVGIGDNTPDAKLAVNGIIHAKEVKVDLIGWPDYVFQPGYALPALKDLEQTIKSTGHLPNIPDAAEVITNGIKLGEMNAKLLEKIEELTLYMIDVSKEVEKLKKENAELRDMINK